MMDKIHQRLHNDEGFTLVELMVVVLIIAILMAIAIPTFLGARQKAQDRAAQSNLRNALTAEKVYYVDSEAYSETAADLSALEPSLVFNSNAYAAAASNAGEVFLQIDATSGIVCLTATSASGTSFALKDNTTGTNPGTYYSTGILAACDNGVAAPWQTNGW